MEHSQVSPCRHAADPARILIPIHIFQDSRIGEDFTIIPSQVVLHYNLHIPSVCLMTAILTGTTVASRISRLYEALAFCANDDLHSCARVCCASTSRGEHGGSFIKARR